MHHDSRPRYLYRLPDGERVFVIHDHGSAPAATVTYQKARETLLARLVSMTPLYHDGVQRDVMGCVLSDDDRDRLVLAPPKAAAPTPSNWWAKSNTERAIEAFESDAALLRGGSSDERCAEQLDSIRTVLGHLGVTLGRIADSLERSEDRQR